MAGACYSGQLFLNKDRATLVVFGETLTYREAHDSYTLWALLERNGSVAAPYDPNVTLVIEKRGHLSKIQYLHKLWLDKILRQWTITLGYSIADAGPREVVLRFLIWDALRTLGHLPRGPHHFATEAPPAPAAGPRGTLSIIVTPPPEDASSSSWAPAPASSAGTAPRDAAEDAPSSPLCARVVTDTRLSLAEIGAQEAEALQLQQKQQRRRKQEERAAGLAKLKSKSKPKRVTFKASLPVPTVPSSQGNGSDATVVPVVKEKKAKKVKGDGEEVADKEDVKVKKSKKKDAELSKKDAELSGGRDSAKPKKAAKKGTLEQGMKEAQDAGRVKETTRITGTEAANAESMPAGDVSAVREDPAGPQPTSSLLLPPSEGSGRARAAA